MLGGGGVGLAELLAEREWAAPTGGGGAGPGAGAAPEGGESLEQILAARQWGAEDFGSPRGRASSSGGSSSSSAGGRPPGGSPALAEEGSLSKLLAEREWGDGAPPAAGGGGSPGSPSGSSGSGGRGLTGEPSLGRLLAERDWGPTGPGGSSSGSSPRAGGEGPSDRQGARAHRAAAPEGIRAAPQRPGSARPSGEGGSPGGSGSSSHGSFSLSPRGVAAAPPPRLEREVSLGDLLVHSEEVLRRDPLGSGAGSPASPSNEAEDIEPLSSVADQLRLINKGLEVRIRDAGHVWYGESLVDSYRSPPGGAKKAAAQTSPASVLESEDLERMGVKHQMGDALSMVNVFAQRLGLQQRQARRSERRQPKRKAAGKARPKKTRVEAVAAAPTGSRKDAASGPEEPVCRDAGTQPPAAEVPERGGEGADVEADAKGTVQPGTPPERASPPPSEGGRVDLRGAAAAADAAAPAEKPGDAGAGPEREARCSPLILQRRLQAALQHTNQLEALEAGLQALEAEYGPRDNVHNQEMLEFLQALERQRTSESLQHVAAQMEAMGEEVGKSVEIAHTENSAALADLRAEVLQHIERHKPDVSLADLGAAAEGIRTHQESGIARLREELATEIEGIASDAEAKHRDAQSARESLRSETQLSLHRLREDLLQQLKHLERQMHHGVVGARETAAVWVRSQENSLKDLRQELVHRLDAITGPTGGVGWTPAAEAVAAPPTAQTGAAQSPAADPGAPVPAAAHHSEGRPPLSPMAGQAQAPPREDQAPMTTFPAEGASPALRAATGNLSAPTAQMPPALRKLEFQAGVSPALAERPIRPEVSHASTVPEDYSQDFDEFMAENSEAAAAAERSLASVAEDSALEIPESPSYIPESPSSIPEEVTETDLGLVTEEASLRDVTEEIIGMESMASLDPLSPSLEASIPEMPSETSPVSVDLQPQPSTASDAVVPENIESPDPPAGIASEPSGRDEDFHQIDLGIMVVPSNMYKDNTSSDSVPAGTTSGEEARAERGLGETASDSEERSEIPSVVSEDPAEMPCEHWQGELSAPELSPTALYTLDGELTSDPSRVGSDTSYAEAAAAPEGSGSPSPEMLSEPSSEAGGAGPPAPPPAAKELHSDPSEVGSEPLEGILQPEIPSDEPSEIGTDPSHTESQLESHKSEEFLPAQAIVHTLRPSPQVVDGVTEALLGSLLEEALAFVLLRRDEAAHQGAAGARARAPEGEKPLPPRSPRAPPAAMPVGHLGLGKRQRALSTMDAPATFYERQVEQVLASQELCLDSQGEVEGEALEDDVSLAEAKQAAYSLDRLVHDLCQQAVHQSATKMEVQEDSAMYPVLNPAPLMGRQLPPPALAQYVARQVKSWVGVARGGSGGAPGAGAAAAALRGDAAEEEALWLRGCSTEDVYVDTAEALVDDLLADAAHSLLRLA